MILKCKVLSTNCIFSHNQKVSSLPFSILELDGNKELPLVFALGVEDVKMGSSVNVIPMSYVSLSNSPLVDDEVIVALPPLIYKMYLTNLELFNFLFNPLFASLSKFLASMGMTYESTAYEAEELLINKYNYLIK